MAWSQHSVEPGSGHQYGQREPQEGSKRGPQPQAWKVEIMAPNSASGHRGRHRHLKLRKGAAFLSVGGSMVMRG